jgi:hypothetical protein
MLAARIYGTVNLQNTPYYPSNSAQGAQFLRSSSYWRTNTSYALYVDGLPHNLVRPNDVRFGIELSGYNSLSTPTTFSRKATALCVPMCALV